MTHRKSPHDKEWQQSLWFFRRVSGSFRCSLGVLCTITLSGSTWTAITKIQQAACLPNKGHFHPKALKSGWPGLTLVDSVSGDDLIPGFRWHSRPVSFLCREGDELWSCLGVLYKDKNSVLGDFTLLRSYLPQNSTSSSHHSGTRSLEFPWLFGGHTNILSQVSQGSMTE